MPGIKSSCVAFTTLTATVSTSAVAITSFTGYTAAKLERASRAIVAVIAQPISLTIDGTTPTATVGIGIAANNWFTVEGIDNITNIKCIRTGASDANVTITLME